MKPVAADYWRGSHVRMVLAMVLFALTMLGHTPAYAASEDDTDVARAQFQQAIGNGDVQQARRILNGLTDGIARVIAFASYNERFSGMRKLESQNKPAVYEQMALFLSTVNSEALFKGDWNSVVPSNHSLSGTVKDDTSSQPLVGVKVIVAGHEAITDANGTFSLTGLPEGTFDLYVFAPGFSSFGGSWIIRAGATDRPRSFMLHSTAPKKKVVGTETIEGTVVDAQSGEPIAGAQFMIHTDASLPRRAETDSQGHFTLAGVHTGLSELSIFPPNVLYHLPFGQKVNISGGGKTHTVVWKLERTKGSMAIAAGAWIGKVLRADTEEPVEGARIGFGESWVTTDKDGRFTLALPETGESIGIEDLQKMDNLSPAEKRQALDKLYATMASGGSQPADKSYLVKANHNNFSEFSKSYPANRDKKQEMIIHLDPLKIGDVEGIVVDANTGKPVASATIQVQSLIAQSKPDGTFLIEKLHSGDLLLQAKAKRYRAAENKITLKPLGKEKTRFELEPITTGTVTGVALNATDQKPLTNVKIELGARTAMTDAQGHFEMQDMDAGDATVQGSKPVFKPASQGVQVIAAESVNVTLKLEPITTGTVTGVALNAADQKPLANVKITLGTLSTTTDAQGQFKLLEVQAGDALVGGNKEVFKPASQGVQVQAAKSVDVTLKLEPITTGTVTGLVLNAADQKPLAGATIAAGSKTATTDAKGKFTLSNMGVGPLTVQASKPVFKPGSAGIEVKAAESMNVTLKLEPITVGTVTGLALNVANQQPLAGVKVSLGTLSTTTDAQGRFKLSNVHAGDALVQGSKAVFKAATQGVKVQAAKSVDVTLKLEPITVGTVTGVALNAATQNPLAGVKVTLGALTAMTDAQGRFKLIDVHAGDTKVEGSKDVFKPASQGVRVQAAKSVDVTLKLEPITTGAVTGRALNAATQKPLAGVKVTLGAFSAITDAQGRFKLPDVHAGDALVLGNKAVFKAASQGVKVQAAKSVDVTLKLEPITVGTVTGVALNAVDQKPLAGVAITAGSKSATTDATGRFMFSDMGAGPLTVQASKPVFKPGSAGVEVIAAGSVNVTLKLEPITTGTVTGLALNAATQKPLAGVKVTLGTLSATTDKQGRFKLSDVHAGSVTVGGSKDVFKPATQDVKVQAAKSVDVTLKLEPITTASISGIVVDNKTQKPIAGVRVSAGDKADETDAKGYFALEKITAGQIALVSRHPDYKTNDLAIKLKAGRAYDQKVEMELRREDVMELEAALKKKGTVDLYGIHFDSGKDQFLPSSLSTLQAVSEVIKASSGKVFELSGHTDSDGADNYNQNLSERRAKTVIKWLVAHGVSADQLRARGYGETKPVVPNNTKAGKALNRRAQLRVIK